MCRNDSCILALLSNSGIVMLAFCLAILSLALNKIKKIIKKYIFNLNSILSHLLKEY